MKKTHSIQSRFLATVIFAMLAVTVFIGGISIYEVDNYIQREAENFVKLTCDNEVIQINDTFGDMEKSVKIMESYAIGFFDGDVDYTDRELQQSMLQRVDAMFADVAENTSGAIAYYFRFAPEISDSKTGLFYTKLDGGEEYVSLEPTDISLYDKDDTEHVGWYWQPYEAGKPVWMKPYFNRNNGILMISYVVPMYVDGDFIGIVGMDFDYNVLTDKVHEVAVYENGFAHLESDGVAVCEVGEETREIDSEKYLSVSKELVNGMTLVVSASYDDIRSIRYDIAFKIFFVTVVLSLLFTLIVIIAVRRIVNPLKKLTDASLRLSSGVYDVETVQSNTREINLLSDSFENMARHLREREELLIVSANHDSLTGLLNRTSYKTHAKDFEEQIASGKADFGIVVLDLNHLKETNDRYGHNVGDELIEAAAKVLSRVFCDSLVFRLGGDEFMAILQNEALENESELFEALDKECESTLIREIPLSIARGFARYDKAKDKSFTDTLKRADVAMYENKRKSMLYL